ncbi:MAG: 3-oxoacyl-[acyl-carrier-protein] reductase [Clostridiales bacterium]|nr:3-oxoacyl-[acyl-carrier-protein] reductase [Clostridiales bacterium]
MLLEGKKAVVTGSSRGIGKAIALKLAREGADVVINYYMDSDLADAESVVNEIKALGRDALAVQGDVSDSSQAENIIKEAEDRFGRVDILVNNAGITRDGLLIKMKEEEWDAVLNANLKSVYNCTKAVAKLMMKQRYGRIVNIASVVGVTGNAGQGNYAASKAGVIGFSKSIAKELASRNITVNAIAPGFIQTDMTKKLSDSIIEQINSQIPQGRMGTAEDVANLAGFLASDEAAYITGQVINVDGGMVML